MSIRKSDLLDADVVDSEELASDGYSIYLTTSLVSTSPTGNLIIINYPIDGEGLITGLDHPAESGDLIRLVGTTGGAADGYFTIDSILTDLSFSVKESIASTTGGNIYFMHPPGASKVGFDPTGLTITNAHDVQDAIKDIERGHESLRQLIHFLDEGGGKGFATTTYKEILPMGAVFPTSVVWYLDIAKTKKLIEQLVVWTGTVPTQITWNLYDKSGTSITETVIDIITYVNNIFEYTRERNYI